MRVRCIRLEKVAGEELAEHPAIAIGREYIVFAIHFPHGHAQFVVDKDNDEGRTTQWPVDIFEIVDDRIPSNWAVTIDHEDGLIIGPRPWLRSRFWDDFQSSGPERRTERHQAFEDYRRERAIVIEES